MNRMIRLGGFALALLGSTAALARDPNLAIRFDGPSASRGEDWEKRGLMVPRFSGHLC